MPVPGQTKTYILLKNPVVSGRESKISDIIEDNTMKTVTHKHLVAASNPSAAFFVFLYLSSKQLLLLSILRISLEGGV